MRDDDKSKRIGLISACEKVVEVGKLISKRTETSSKKKKI